MNTRFADDETLVHIQALNTEIAALNAHNKALREACSTAYGLLWQMQIDKATTDGRLKSQAREALRNVLTIQEQGDGIARAMTTPNVKVRGAP